MVRGLAWRALARTLGIGLFGSAMLVVACTNDGSGLVAANCALNSDCNSGLLCVGGRCRMQCADDRDCTGLASCVAVNGRRELRTCQLDEQVSCSETGACAEGTSCSTDNRCREVCGETSQCGPQQVCTDHVCLRSGDVDTGSADAGRDRVDPIGNVGSPDAATDTGSAKSDASTSGDSGKDATTNVDSGVDAADSSTGTGDAAPSGDGGADGGDTPDGGTSDASDASSTRDSGIPNECADTQEYYFKLLQELAMNPNWRDCNADTPCQPTRCCYTGGANTGICLEQ